MPLRAIGSNGKEYCIFSGGADDRQALLHARENEGVIFSCENGLQKGKLYGNWWERQKIIFFDKIDDFVIVRPIENPIDEFFEDYSKHPLHAVVRQVKHVNTSSYLSVK